MFEDYKSSLLDFYHVKRKNHRLTLNLDQPGREKLRKECVEVFKRKNTPRDKDFIKSVFDPSDEYEDQVRSIEKFSLDRFRPLISFLKEEVKIVRDDKLIKLLAWLIDFPAYNEWRDLSEEELKFIFEEAAKKPIEEECQEEEDKNDVEIDETDPEREEEAIQVEDSNDNQKKNEELEEEGQRSDELEAEELEEDNSVSMYISRFSIRQITVASIILLFIGTTSFSYWERRTKIRLPDPDEKFMYWDEDHYEPVKDGKQNVGAPIIPLNKATLLHQQKITLPDTLTSYSIGKVWYKGHGKGHEFFTDSGAYPQDLQRVLKPLTNNILTKYTSNYRYMLTRLVWFICAAFFISLCGFAVSRLEKEVKPPVKEIETETEKEEIPEFHSNELQATNA